MYRTFNMGHRLEIFTDEKSAKEIIKISEGFGVDAKVIGYCVPSTQREVELQTPYGTFSKML